jgi:hypothetical protein
MSWRNCTPIKRQVSVVVTRQTKSMTDKRIKGEIKVALIDDGVRSNYAGLDDNIAAGTNCAAPKPDGSTQRFTQNYNTSLYGHGTVMAYYIRRVCPRVRLYVAKLDGRQTARGVAFSIESAAAVS